MLKSTDQELIFGEANDDKEETKNIDDMTIDIDQPRKINDDSVL